jgi:hypothetical protein
VKAKTIPTLHNGRGLGVEAGQQPGHTIASAHGFAEDCWRGYRLVIVVCFSEGHPAERSGLSNERLKQETPTHTTASQPTRPSR